MGLKDRVEAAGAGWRAHWREQGALLLVLLFPLAKNAALVAAAWAWWRGRRTGSPRPLLPAPLRPGLALLLAALLLGTAVSVSVEHSLRVLFLLVPALLAGHAALLLARRDEAVLQASLAGALWPVLALACAAFLYRQVADGPFLFRVDGIQPFSTRNLWSGVLATAFIAALVLAVRERAADAVRARDWFPVLLLLWLLLANNTRGALLAALAGGGALLLLRYRPWQVLAWGGFLALLGLLLLLDMPEGARGVGLQRQGDNTNLRGLLWDLSAHLVQQRPWAGWGPGVFKEADAVNALLPAKVQGQASPHNWVLELLFSFGIIGSALWLAGLALLARAVRTHCTHGSLLLRRLGAGLLAFLLVNGLLDFRALGLYFLCTLFFAGTLVLGYRAPGQSPRR